MLPTCAGGSVAASVVWGPLLASSVAAVSSVDDDPQVALYREYVDLYGLGWSVDDAAAMTIPAFTGALLPTYATVPGGAR